MLCAKRNSIFDFSKYAAPFVFFALFGILGLSAFGAESKEGNIEETCPATNFDDFFKHFLNEQTTQKAFTKFPIKKTILVDADPEPRAVTKKLNKSDVKFPLAPAEEARRAMKILARVEKTKTLHPRGVIYKEDTDYQVVYFFSKNQCWHLTKIEDRSL
jgi:hypothetical protein